MNWLQEKLGRGSVMIGSFASCSNGGILPREGVFRGWVSFGIEKRGPAFLNTPFVGERIVRAEVNYVFIDA
jgi:hypothetical protein